jgi:hypothetical protein
MRLQTLSSHYLKQNLQTFETECTFTPTILLQTKKRPRSSEKFFEDMMTFERNRLLRLDNLRSEMRQTSEKKRRPLSQLSDPGHYMRERSNSRNYRCQTPTHATIKKVSSRKNLHQQLYLDAFVEKRVAQSADKLHSVCTK